METATETQIDLDEAIGAILRQAKLSPEEVRVLFPQIRRLVIEHAGKEKARITLDYVKRTMREQEILR